MWSGRRLLLPLVAFALIAALWAWQQRRGPEWPAYALKTGPLVQTVVATGRVTSLSRVQVGAEITATVVERRVREGDRVQRGDILAVLRNDEAVARLDEAAAALDVLRRVQRPQAAATLSEAEVRLRQALRERDRRRELLGRGLLPAEAAEQAQQAAEVAEAVVQKARMAAQGTAAGGPEERLLLQRQATARAVRERTLLRAPAAGTVLLRRVEPGDLAQPGRVLFELALDGPTEILVPVDEENLAVLAPGQSVQVVADAWPDRPFAATVDRLAPTVDATRGTVDLWLRVASPPDGLRQDMTVTANIQSGLRAAALAVPNDALALGADGRPQVLRVEDGRLRRVAVTLGLRGLVHTEITAGLAADDVVLADAAAARALPDGAAVRPVLQALPAATDATADRRELPVSLD
ncbi:MAG: hypothetical protein RL026_2537 [Pseudomonadota bacterium]|jgi:HlyD family secretion protein